MVLGIFFRHWVLKAVDEVHFVRASAFVWAKHESIRGLVGNIPRFPITTLLKYIEKTFNFLLILLTFFFEEKISRFEGQKNLEEFLKFTSLFLHNIFDEIIR